ncbi:MAG: hypothetical protein LBB24_00265, partial [Rickettsiales bacterium]|jgi:hypothetical protein|nr:hypothetical protein [Rickettsiales bacterium]
MKCKYCLGERVKCNGKKYGKQRYYCNDCHRSFSLDDARVKRDFNQKIICLILYVHNVSLRSIQRTIELYFNTTISFGLIGKWIGSASKLLWFDTEREKIKEKPKTIEILELDELYSYFYNIKKNKGNRSKYGLLLIEEEVRLLHLKQV